MTESKNGVPGAHSNDNRERSTVFPAGLIPYQRFIEGCTGLVERYRNKTGVECLTFELVEKVGRPLD